LKKARTERDQVKAKMVAAEKDLNAHQVGIVLLILKILIWFFFLFQGCCFSWKRCSNWSIESICQRSSRKTCW